MNKAQFLKNEEVINFISWLSDNFSKIEINLKIKASSKVPNGINKKIIGINNILPLYRWRSDGMAIGDWNETKTKLTQLGNDLKKSVTSGDDDLAFATCVGIFKWGGERNANQGARPFLQSKVMEGGLCKYIAKAGITFMLETSDEAELKNIEYMNAMLTKIHALYASDGLPIYDSRVAASIATLVELWRIEKGLTTMPLNYLLSFPSTDTKRTVKSAFETTKFVPYMIRYNPKNKSRETYLWASAKVRLGWIINEVLQMSNQIYVEETNRMHAFEACLFMIGSNVSCLKKSV